MPENYTSLIVMVIVLVCVCGIVGFRALRSRRRDPVVGETPDNGDGKRLEASRQGGAP